MKLRMKKILPLLLCLVLTFPILTAGGIDGSKIGETIGYAAEFDGSRLRIIGEPLTDSGLEDVVIYVGAAPIYDLLTGFPADIGAINEDMSVRAVYSVGGYEPFDALAVWLNWDYDDAAVFTVMVSGSISYGEDHCIFLCSDGKFRVTLAPDTVIIDPYYGFLSPGDVKPGQEFFIWVDMVTASTPALVYPDQVVLVR